MKKNVYVFLLVGLMGLTACGNRNNKQAKEKGEDVIVETALTVDDCNGEDGYVWSEMEQNCIRPFEVGIPMLKLKAEDSYHVAYVVFNADSTRVEIFLPEGEKTRILDRRALPKGGYAWNVEDDDTLNLRQVDGVWVIEQRDTVIYKNTPELGPIHARFQGSDGITRRLYWVDATFYPEASRAILKLDDNTYDLVQYATGSGYGYKNDEADLRGKGIEATLTFADDQLRDLTLREIKE